MKICPMAAELFHADEEIDRHDKVNSRFSLLCKHAYKGAWLMLER